MEQSQHLEENTGTTMQLWDLPEDILIIIMGYFDLRTLHSLYETCSELKSSVCMESIVKQCNLSKSVMATVNTLKLDFFKDIANHLQLLNVSAVPDLTGSEFLPSLKTLKCLKTLDVSYTNINILDVIEVPEICTTLKDLTINFNFGYQSVQALSSDTLLQCQALFQQFENIHFIGSQRDMLESKLPMYLLRNVTLNRLTYSLPDFFMRANVQIDFVENDEMRLPQIDNFFIYLINYYGKEHSFSNMTCYPIVLTLLDFTRYEIILILKDQFAIRRVYASKIFTNFLNEEYNVKAECITTCKEFSNNTAIMMWDKAATNFNKTFFNELVSRIRQYVPYNLGLPNKKDIPKHCNCFYSSVADVELPNLVLDYDEIFKDKQEFKLSLILDIFNTKSIALSANCDYLKKLTYLSLSGLHYRDTHYNPEFFNILFSCCVNIITLNVEHDGDLSVCASYISNTLPLSNSLKNIRIADIKIDFEALFSAFSQCKSLENIHTVDKQYYNCEPNNLADPSMVIKQLPHLYSVYVVAPMAEEVQQNRLQMFNDAKTKYGKGYVSVVLEINKGQTLRYSPFIDVFRLCPLKSI